MMVDECGMKPNEIVLGCMLDALVCNEKVEDAVTLLSKWKSRIAPNTVMYSTIIKGFAKKNFKSTPVLDYALAVEQITTRKRANLILNVDGCIAVSFVDMIRSCGAFSQEECDDLMSFGCLNGLFVLGRSIGFIGHYLDQLRLKQPLYRHPWDDITYIQELAGQES